MSRLPFRFALRYLFARKSHNVINIISGISVAGMAVGTAALIAILSVFNGFNALVEDSLSQVDADLVIRPATGKTFEPEEDRFDFLNTAPEVQRFASIIEDQAFLSHNGKQAIAHVKGVSSVIEEESPLRNYVVDGQFALHMGSMPRAVMGLQLARQVGASPRFVAPVDLYYPDRDADVSLSAPLSNLRKVSVRTAGLLNVNPTVDASLVIVPIETLRQLMGYETEISAIEITLAPGTRTEAFRREVQARIGPAFLVLDRYRQNEALYKMMRYEKLAIYLILVFVVLIIALNIYSSLTMLRIEKQEDMETLRSLGTQEQTIRRIFVLEGWFIALLGLGIGLVTGIVLVLAQQRLGLVKMPGGFVVDAYPVVLQWSDVLLTVGGIALVGYFIALLPTFHKI